MDTEGVPLKKIFL